MPTIRFNCPNCGAANSAPVGDAGTVVECTACQTDIEIPSAPKPPPKRTEDEAVEVHPCPKCGTRLSVLTSDLDTHVECPKCETEFVAARADGPPPAPVKQSSTRTPKLVERDEPDEDEDDKPKKKSPKRKSKAGLRDKRYRTFGPHDGVLMLVLSGVGVALDVFGLCCLIGSFGGPVVGVFVIIKSSLSIKEVKNGTMEPKGRVMLEIARALGILAILLGIGGIVLKYVMDAITPDEG